MELGVQSETLQSDSLRTPVVRLQAAARGFLTRTVSEISFDEDVEVENIGPIPAQRLLNTWLL